MSFYLIDSFPLIAHKCEHRLCVLLQRTETNPCNKSHPSLCYLNTNYIIVHTSWQRGVERGEMSAKIPWRRWVRVGSVFCQVEGGVEGGQGWDPWGFSAPTYIILPQGPPAWSHIKQNPIEFQTQQLFFQRVRVGCLFCPSETQSWICPAP